jgi:imidazolonepropionase-like amidohydrolase
LLAATGMPTRQALAAGTRLSAEAVGLSHIVGTLEPGKVADVTVVTGDPTQRIADVRNVTTVIRGGRVLVEEGGLVA